VKSKFASFIAEEGVGKLSPNNNFQVGDSYLSSISSICICFGTNWTVFRVVVATIVTPFLRRLLPP
jgi:hypothetical protein